MVTLTSSFSFPSNAKELLIIPNTQRITHDDNAGVIADLFPPTHVITHTLTSVPQQYISYGYLAIANIEVIITFRVTNVSISLINIRDKSNNDVYPDTKLTVFYK